MLSQYEQFAPVFLVSALVQLGIYLGTTFDGSIIMPVTTYIRSKRQEGGDNHEGDAMRYPIRADILEDLLNFYKEPSMVPCIIIELMRDYNPFSSSTGLTKKQVCKYVNLVLTDTPDIAKEIIYSLPDARDLLPPSVLLKVRTQQQGQHNVKSKPNKHNKLIQTSPVLPYAARKLSQKRPNSPAANNQPPTKVRRQQSYPNSKVERPKCVPLRPNLLPKPVPPPLVCHRYPPASVPLLDSSIARSVPTTPIPTPLSQTDRVFSLDSLLSSPTKTLQNASSAELLDLLSLVKGQRDGSPSPSPLTTPLMWENIQPSPAGLPFNCLATEPATVIPGPKTGSSVKMEDDTITGDTVTYDNFFNTLPALASAVASPQATTSKQFDPLLAASADRSMLTASKLPLRPADTVSSLPGSGADILTDNLLFSYLSKNVLNLDSPRLTPTLPTNTTYSIDSNANPAFSYTNASSSGTAHVPIKPKPYTFIPHTNKLYTASTPSKHQNSAVFVSSAAPLHSAGTDLFPILSLSSPAFITTTSANGSSVGSSRGIDSIEQSLFPLLYSGTPLSLPTAYHNYQQVPELRVNNPPSQQSLPLHPSDLHLPRRSRSSSSISRLDGSMF